MKNYAKVAALLGLSAATLSASGWRIPENSLNSTALSAAYVAGANGADASYYNPANMAWMPDGAEMETALTYINLPKIKYIDSASNPSALSGDADSKVENFIIPTFHYISPKVNDWRFGLSMVAPGGLSKRWDEAFGKASAEEFTLTIIELNPSASYQVNDKFSVGFGARALYTDGVVKSDARDLNPALIARDLTGDSIDFGYNLALSYKATDQLTVSSTYRSKVNLTVEGKADLYAGAVLVHDDLGASVEVPLPAALTLAAAYNFGETTVEFVYERTYWSAYKELDFEYASAINPAFVPSFDDPQTKDWSDSNAYRIGVTHKYSDKLKLMAAYAYDEAGANDEHLGFELPDSDAQLFSAGFEYKLNEKMAIGLAYLYDKKESKSVALNTGGLSTKPYGTFEDASAHLVTASFKYRF